MDFENMNLDEMLGALSAALDKMKDLDGKVISDRVSVLPMNRWYHVQTGPQIISKNPDAYVTVLAVESFDREHETAPVGVETYESREEAIRGHDYWRRAMMDNPTRIMKDVITGKITTIDF